MVLYLLLGLALEALFRKTLVRKLLGGVWGNQEGRLTTTRVKVAAAMVRELPPFLGLLVFTGTAYLAYFSSTWSDSPLLRLVFLALLVAIVLFRFAVMSLRVLFAPSSPLSRLLPISCSTARTWYFMGISIATYFIATFMFVAIIRKLGAQPITVNLLQLLFTTVLLGSTAILLFSFRRRISTALLKGGGANCAAGAGWVRNYFARLWYLTALAYLGCLWILFLVDLTDTESRHRGAFLVSFLILPIWLISDKLVQWLVGYSLAALKIREEDVPAEDNAIEATTDNPQPQEHVHAKSLFVARFALVAGLLLWLASLWNIRIPLLSILPRVLFDGVIIIALSLLLWAFISRLIENKIREDSPPDDDNGSDDEWGGAAAKGRAYTLLPMLRRFIGTILLAMVTLTIVSALGVNIGPLLAGAGVVGLAVGFGAQKLVADMFSGFFYLLDDAFRVGEYIEAGTISGIVENITLRNVMLRHHRGMLQIVPHSDLGPITNYMRGGIVVKFNLDFPYDADIDQIRKIVKRVGQSMLEDEELASDFIRPVKSQGVREITNSVMTIRIKFTARPGAHFVIRREAYRRITDALRAKGINYAHRKVIVDLPREQHHSAQTEAAPLLGAAGAAARNIIEETEQQNGAPDNS